MAASTELIKIKITANNKIYMGNKLISGENLEGILEEQISRSPNSSLIIEADKNSKLSPFVFLVDTAKSIGIEKISISTTKN